MIPESREVYEHGNHEYDRGEERYTRQLIFLAGLVSGILLMLLLGVLL